VRESWQNWDEVTIRVAQLPPTVTTWDLWQKFQAYGNVIFIEIFENRQGVREDVARIKFSPAPATAFWRREVSFMKPDGEGFYVKCSPEPMKRVFRVQSPIHKTKSYPEQLNFSPVNLGFGVMFGEKAMMMKREETAFPPINKASTPGIGFRVDLLRKRLTVSFQLQLKDSQSTDGGALSRLTNYMFQVPFTQLEKFYRVNIDKDKWALVLSLDSAPLFYRKRQDAERCHQEKALIWSEFDMWYRQTNIVYDPRELGRMVVSLEQQNTILNIGNPTSKNSFSRLTSAGRWTTYRFVFDNKNVLPTEYSQLKEALSDFNIEIIDLDYFTIIPTAEPQLWSALNSPKINEETGLQSLMNTDALRTDLPFEVRYQLEVCISQNILPEHNITPEFIHKLAEMSAEGPERTCDILEYFCEEEKVIYDPMCIFENRNAFAYSAKTSIPPYCAYTRKVTVTPTTIYISSPTVETSNRVIRRFSEYGDRFLRVQFTDEKTEVCSILPNCL
jgi:RNA-dependent RNA polymerase